MCWVCSARAYYERNGRSGYAAPDRKWRCRARCVILGALAGWPPREASAAPHPADTFFILTTTSLSFPLPCSGFSSHADSARSTAQAPPLPAYNSHAPLTSARAWSPLPLPNAHRGLFDIAIPHVFATSHGSAVAPTDVLQLVLDRRL